MNIFFTSDHHFGHSNIIKYCNRPFSCANEMDEVMIDRWNSVVKTGDTVYLLGDVTLNDHNFIRPIFRRLNGYINVVPGGHDYRWFHQDLRLGRKLKKLSPMYTLEIDSNNGFSRVITLCHYPLYVWDRSHYGYHHLHGHTHGTIGLICDSGDIQLPPNQVNGKRMDMSVDCHDFYPIHIDDIFCKFGDDV